MHGIVADLVTSSEVEQIDDLLKCSPLGRTERRLRHPQPNPTDTSHYRGRQIRPFARDVLRPHSLCIADRAAVQLGRNVGTKAFSSSSHSGRLQPIRIGDRPEYSYAKRPPS